MFGTVPASSTTGNYLPQPLGCGLTVSLLHAPGRGGCLNWGTQDLAAEVDTLAALVQEAVRLGATVLTISPARVKPAGPEGATAGYVQSLRGTLDVMRRSIPLLEQTGLTVGLEAAEQGFLLSPVECRELIDRINSPYVGISLSGPRIAPIGWAVDWVRILGRRVISVSSSVDRLGALDDEVRAALTEVGFAGPVLIAGMAADALRESRHWTAPAMPEAGG
jgi:sugar phosphate isomerase/epimerase